MRLKSRGVTNAARIAMRKSGLFQILIREERKGIISDVLATP